MNEKDKETLSSGFSFVDSRRDFLNAHITATAAALVIASQRNGAQVVSVVLLHSP
jgi:hypothetical protein